MEKLNPEIEEELKYIHLLDKYDDVFTINKEWYLMRDYLIKKNKDSKAFLTDQFDKIIRLKMEPAKEERILSFNENLPKPIILHTAWNYATYLERFYDKYLDSIVRDPDKLNVTKIIQAVETKAFSIIPTIQFILGRVTVILQKIYNITSLPYPEANRIALMLPVRQYFKRVVFNMGVPKIKIQDDYEDKIEEIKQDLKQGDKVTNDLASKYFKELDRIESEHPMPKGLKLTTEEKLELIAERVLDELIEEDYDEIESA
ncbi:hypothetical protein [Acidianus bottle-shaped virus 3 strain ABV3]|uniref:Uncharacterized protein n=1 Tax=Acidianus bottle-shaped virus 3 strain ABV3 TaxID=1732174 RepID=A0A0N9PCN9_9VIRU|nr:hypothetical protein AVU00_gp01 [Acidianus bottle-shaped virus 3 strain ABV3]ALG96803.1 hypothetical protein [Acidianus bottle-shaped virus 3 strain ABV3]